MACLASEDDAVDAKLEVFRDRNSVLAVSPVLALKKSLNHAWSLLWEGQLDAVTGASREWGRSGSNQSDLDEESGASQRLDGVSGASQSESGEQPPEIRAGTRIGLQWSRNGRVFSGSIYGSKENDYQSFSPSLSGSWDFAERNTTLSWAASWFFDRMSPPGSWAEIGGGAKRIQSYTLGLSQTFTPLTLAGVTANWIQTSGYIGHPYNPVATVDSGLVAEDLPRQRDALAISGQLVQGWILDQQLGSVNAEYRWFQDSWDLRSHTLTLQVSQHATEATYFRLQGRYYTQTGAAFVPQGLYAGNEQYRTADIRFYPFQSWLLGLKINSTFPESWEGVLPQRWDLSYDHLVRDTHGNPDLYQLYPRDGWYHQGTLRMGLGWNL